jgi:hypothetical protein
LRNIGCPEQTIRDIIVADVHQVYQSRRKALEDQLVSDHKAPIPPEGGKPQPLEIALANLRAEEREVISSLLGPPSERSAAVQSPVPSVTRTRLLDRQALVPLTFQEVDLSGMNLDQRQIAVINELRQKFRDDLSGAGQNPADPAYLKRWQEAQRENDDLVSGLLGGQFFLDYQIQATQPGRAGD